MYISKENRNMSCSRYIKFNQPLTIPFLNNLSETTVIQGKQTKPIYINGSNFNRNSTVVMDSKICFSFCNNSNQLGFLIPWNEIQISGTVDIQVINPGKNDAFLYSNVLAFTIVL